MLYGIWSKLKSLINNLRNDQMVNDNDQAPTHEIHAAQNDLNAPYTRIDRCTNGMFDDSGLSVKEVEGCWREDECCNTGLTEKDTNKNALAIESCEMPTMWDELSKDLIVEESELVVNVKSTKKKSSKKKAAKKAVKSEKKSAKTKTAKKSKKSKKN